MPPDKFSSISKYFYIAVFLLSLMYLLGITKIKSLKIFDLAEVEVNGNVLDVSAILVAAIVVLLVLIFIDMLGRADARKSAIVRSGILDGRIYSDWVAPSRSEAEEVRITERASLRNKIVFVIIYVCPTIMGLISIVIYIRDRFIGGSLHDFIF